MSASNDENGVERADLLQRVELMEQMIAEGRQATGRYGWIFVMWGLVYFAAVGWEIFLPRLAVLAWPVCIVLGIVFISVQKTREKRASGRGENPRARTIEAAWKGMGWCISLYVLGAVVSHHIMQPSCTAAILLFLGMANEISAMILRWKMQGVAAAIWWAGGLAAFFTGPRAGVIIFLIATFFGLILFGLYAMMQERQRAKLDSSPARHDA